MKPHLCPLCHGAGKAQFNDDAGNCRICGGRGYLILNEPSDWYVPAVPYSHPYPLPYWPYTVTSGSVTCNPVKYQIVQSDSTNFSAGTTLYLTQ